MARGKNINFFLMDDDYDGRKKCTIANWTGVVYNIPRTMLDLCKERQDLKWSGVYILFGTNEDTGRGVAYIGQAGARKNGEGILNRLMEHKRNPAKDYWTEAVAITTSNNSLGPTEISYLENRLCNMAIKASRYEVKNGNDPTQGNISEEKEAEMEEFIDFAKLIVGTLGHKLFEPINRVKICASVPTNTDEPPIKYLLHRSIKGVGTVEGIGYQTSEGFIVLKGSKIAPVDDGTLTTSLKSRRDNAKIVDGELAEDELFDSPSSAGMFVVGKRGVNGLTSWRTENGVTLKKMETGDEEEGENEPQSDG